MTISTLDEQFETMQSEWRQILQARVEARRLIVLEIVERWEPALEQLGVEARELKSRGRWVKGPFDFMGVVGASRAEVRHSAMVAWLLDPSAGHGLGDRFLRAFLARAFPGQPMDGFESARTECEVARLGCRADIVVWSDGFTLIIENKVDAQEGGDQCDVLYNRFVEEHNALFVLLCPKVRPELPKSATGEAKEAFVVLDYPGLRADLVDALAASADLPPARARHVAEDYVQTLRRVFK